MERPILFSGPMVRAILDGKKTQTRRVVKLDVCYDAVKIRRHCPYGASGDHLWVREAWGVADGDSASELLLLHQCGVFYGADGPDGECTYLDIPFDYPLEKMLKLKTSDKLRPSIHMPRWVSRINLEIKAVRLERLQDISEADAIAEGIVSGKICPGNHIYGASTPAHGVYGEQLYAPSAKSAYSDLWTKINGAASWDANPYVWVIEFTRIP